MINFFFYLAQDYTSAKTLQNYIIFSLLTNLAILFFIF